MVELTELDGVGPARSASLVEAGYEDVAAVAEADAGQLAEDAEIPEDTALGFIVQAENITASEGADVEESEPVTQEIAHAVEGDELEEEAEADDNEGEGEGEGREEKREETKEEDAEEPFEEGYDRVAVSFDLASPLEHDVFFASLMRHTETMIRSNQTNTAVLDSLLDELRDTGDGQIHVEVEPDDLNLLHNAVRKMVVEYQGNNLIDHMNAMKAVQNQVNEHRDEHLF
jgi:hypothetical protein